MAWSTQYVTKNEVKHYLRISTGDTQDDAEIDFAREAASRAVDKFCNRQFGTVASSTEGREYTPHYDRRRARWAIETDDMVQSSTSLTITVDDDDDQDFNDVTIRSTAVRRLPLNAVDVGRPFEKIIINVDSTGQPVAGEGTVRVKAKWGWASVPSAVKQATLLQASRFFVRRNSPYGIAGSPDVGSELRLLSRVDPDVAVALGPYVRWWGAQ